MTIRELTTKDEMLVAFDIVKEMYPTITPELYDQELDIMLDNNYRQAIVVENETIVGLTGYWINSKLWCGKYIELDNVIISSKHRSKGIGEFLFRYMEEKAKTEQCNLMALDSYTDNFKAHKFFYAMGYVPRGFHFIHVLNKDNIR